MGELSETVRKFGLSHIKPRHQEIARRIVLGQTQKEVCDALNISQPRMSVICASPLFKIEVKRLAELRDSGVIDIAQDLKEMSPGALETLERTMYRSGSERIQVHCAESILDRAGHSKINKVEGNFQHNFNSMTHKELLELVEQRIERVEEAGNTTQKAADEAEAIEIEWDEVETETEAEVALNPKINPNPEKKDDIKFGKEI